MFQVEWVQSVLDEILAQWLDADSQTREAITQAVHRVDMDLGSDPFGHGESRDGAVRIHFELPLVIHYSVDLENRVATVVQVRIVRPRTH